MPKVSVIIPARNELFLAETIKDVITKAVGDIEVIAVLDGYWPNPPLPEYPNLHIIHRGQAQGMRASINAAAGIARGKYLLKMDAHCAWEYGFDEVLAKDCDDCWIVIPRRYSMDPDSWVAGGDPRQLRKGAYDYHYLDCPMTNAEYFQFHGVIWKERGGDPNYRDKMIDVNLSFQGSAWLMTREHYWKRLEGMSEEGYGTFSQEPQEIGLKTQLGWAEGRVMVNKNTWYCHLHKGHRFGRMYSMSMSEITRGHKYSADFWMGNRWRKRVRDIDWLIEQFMPIPTWPENWSELLYNWRKANL